MKNTPKERDSLAGYRRRIERDLYRNILPFWCRHAPHPRTAGLVGSLTNDLVPDHSVTRGALLTSRVLWTYSSAFRFAGNPSWPALAEYARNDLLDHFHDPKHGGFWWEIAADGIPLRRRKQTYGQAFALYAFIEHHVSTGNPDSLAEGVALFHLLEEHARDTVHGGYVEALDEAWRPTEDMRLSTADLNEPKSQNTHLHVLEAYTSLLRAWPQSSVREALVALTELFVDRIFDPATGHLGLFFARDWGRRSKGISYGHDIEAAWLLNAAADAVGDPVLSKRVAAVSHRLAQVTLAEGVDTDGGVFTAGDPSGVTNTNKEWWPQAEALVGWLDAFQRSGERSYLQAALRSWDFIEDRLIDRRHGEWFRAVTQDGRPIAGDLKISFWKCPYHNSRAAMEALRRLASVAEVRTDATPARTARL